MGVPHQLHLTACEDLAFFLMHLKELSIVFLYNLFVPLLKFFVRIGQFVGHHLCMATLIRGGLRHTKVDLVAIKGLGFECDS